MPQENMLGTKPIPKLMLQFGIPSVVSMLVNSIYNIVDQIFIGQKVGYLGNAATSVTFPFVTIGLALSLMISVGSAANVGLNLGRKKQEEADRILGNGLMLAILVGIVICAVSEIFLQPFLRAFGATDKVMPYALSYAGTYVIGIPFTTVGIMLSDEIRADGNPGYAMKAMLAGAAFNVVFDYIFIFPLEMGVFGAALATILGQLLTMIMAIAYLKRFSTLHFHAKNMKLRPALIKSIVVLGIPSFITQAAMLVQQIVMNQQTIRYGAMSKYGAEIPLTVFGIVMKVNAIMTSVILGITTGSQPIFSYNYGAKKFSRVKKLVQTCLIVCTIIGIIGTLCFHFFAPQIMAIFGRGDKLYEEFAVMALQNMTFLIFILGIQMTASVYFQAVGKPGKALLISLTRSLLFMIPFLFILPALIGIKGVMYAFPASDVASVTLCSILMGIEMKHLNRQIAEQKAANSAVPQ